jgi:hypothetical protein
MLFFTSSFSVFCGEVIRIDSDAVAADQAGEELQKIPFRSGCVENIPRADVHAVEDQRQFVHQSDVHVALGVLDDFRRFSDFDGCRAINPGRHHRAVDASDKFERRRVFAGDDLDDFFEGMLFVARIDAFGRIAEFEIDAPFQARNALEHRPANIFGDARIDG